METPPNREYAELRDAGVAAAEHGRFNEALPLLGQALEVARQQRDRGLEDVAFCNWAGVMVELGRSEDVLAPLREILLRSSHPGNCRLAASHVSRAYELRGEPKKGLFYARIARDRTAQIEATDPTWVAANHNQIGNFLVADSRFEDALDEYRQALAIQPPAEGYFMPTYWQNLGYCHLMLGRPWTAFSYLFESLRAFRRLNATLFLTTNHLDLAYAYLEIDRPRAAIRHAEKALALAHAQADDSSVKNALFLLGEACHLSGDDVQARRHFERLSGCYDDLPFIADFLLSVDVRQMINLRA